MDRDFLLNKLTVLDFALVDLWLYLDTHPDDNDAINKYNCLVRKADEVRAEYEKNFGPLCSFRSSVNKPFDWIDDPWPWQLEFNYNIREVEN